MSIRRRPVRFASEDVAAAAASASPGHAASLRRRYNASVTSQLMARFLITLGVILVVVGLAWPLLGKLGLGRLPGDIHIERGGFSFFFPITTGLIISVVISLILWLLRK